MSSSLWDQLSVSTGSLLTNEECMQLLDTDINIFDDKDLLKNFPTAGTKSEYDGYHFQDEATSSLYPPSPPETKPSRAELANDILEQLDNTCKQETIFPPWLEEKADLHIFENLPQVAQRVEPLPVAVPMHVTPAPAFNTPQPTEELLREFENVFDAVELTHLTPPQSPPGPATQLLLNYAQQAQHTTFSSTILPVPSREQWPVSAPVQIPQTVPDYSYVDVEELVRNRAAQLSSPQHSGGSISGSSPQSSPPSSPRSSSTDDEWSAPCRSKPYSRSTDDRRSRKKEQNKNAATRYRQKKKAQIEVLLTEEQTMRKRNSDLNDKCSDLQREIRYLKGLMRDLFKAKGLIK